MPIRFVLVAPRHPGNIGATARAMCTMGFEELWLVAPESFPHPEATALAAGALPVLERARVVPTLREAVADCGLVLATSARARGEYYWPACPPREAAPRLLAAGEEGVAALVFGPERTGLTNEDLALCSGLVRIPSDPAYESLNLAQAVQVLAYELRCARGQPAPLPPRPVALATVAELTKLTAHLGEVGAHLRHVDRRVCDVAELTTGAAHEHGPNTLVVVLRDGARPFGRFVVGMGVDGQQAEVVVRRHERRR